MEIALEEANKAYEIGEVPIGAIIVHNNKIIAASHNKCIVNSDPTAHAEMLAIRAAAEKLGSNFLTNCDIYSSLEPCAMCAYAISLARIKRLYFGAYDAKSGGVENGVFIFSNKNTHHKPEIYGGIMEEESKILLQRFFQSLR